MFTTAILSVFTLASSTLAVPHRRYPTSPQANISCPIVFDGRVPLSTPATFFNTNNTLFNPDYVKGNNLTWSQILQFPSHASRFDGTRFTAVEVTLSDRSIFQKQKGFRRAGLQFAHDTPTGPGGTGVKTLHWSVKQDPARPLNLTHEYLNVWHETADYAHNQLQFQTGTLIGKNETRSNVFRILDRDNVQLHSVPIDYTQWQNFAATLDYNKNLVQLLYSTGSRPLRRIAAPHSVNLTGGGQFQLGILKKPTGTSDVANAGFQSANLNEGQIYGGLFVEDSEGGCVSL